MKKVYANTTGDMIENAADLNELFKSITDMLETANKSNDSRLKVLAMIRYKNFLDNMRKTLNTDRVITVIPLYDEGRMVVLTFDVKYEGETLRMGKDEKGPYVEVEGTFQPSKPFYKFNK